MAIVLDIIQRRPVRWIIAIVWTVFISIILVQPEQNPVIQTGIPPGPNTLEREIFFTTLHFIAFATTCGLWFWAWFGHVMLKQSLVISLVMSIAIGGVTEYLQSFAPDRYPSWGDFIANCTGAFLMAYIIWQKQSVLSIINKV